MKNFAVPWLFYKPDWRWIIVALCFFVLFHLLVAFFLYEIYRGIFGQKFWSAAAIAFILLALVSVYLGYRSRRVLIIECGVAAILYIIMLKIFLPYYLIVPASLLNISLTAECALLGFIVAFGGAGMGRWIKRKFDIL